MLVLHLSKPVQLQRLDIEARSLPPVTSRGLLQKLKDYKADLAKLRSDAKTAGSSSGVENRWGPVGPWWRCIGPLDTARVRGAG